MAQVFQKCKEDERSAYYPCTSSRCGHPWTVRYREPGGRTGRQREKSFGKKGPADQFAAKIEREKDLGTYIAPTGFLTPLVTVYREFIKSGDRVSGTRYQYDTSLRLHVEPYFRSQPIGAVKPKDLKDWLRWMVEERGYEESTAVNRYETLSGVFSYAVANDYITKNPCQHVRAGRQRAKRRGKKTIRLPTLAEVCAIAAHLPGPYQLLVWLMAGCGLRVGEATAVTLQQFDFENERRIGRNHTACAAHAVAELRRNGQTPHAAHLHALHAFVPALDDHAAAEYERERIVPILARIELLAIGEPARVVNGDRAPGRCLRTRAFGQILVFEPRFRGHDRHRCYAPIEIKPSL